MRRGWAAAALGAGLVASMIVGLDGSASAAETPIDGTGLIVTGYDGDAVVRYNVDGTWSTVATGVNEGWGVTVGPDGSIFIGERDHIQVVAPDGAQRSIGSNYWSYADVAAAADGTLWFTDPQHGALVHMKADGSEISVAGGFAWPLGVAVDGRGDVYVAERDAGQITKVDPAGTRTTVMSGVDAWDVAVDTAGTVYSDTWDGVVKVAADGTRTEFGSGIGSVGIAVDGAGNVFVVDAANDRVVEFGADGSQRTVANTFSYPTNIALVAPPAFGDDVPAGTVGAAYSSTFPVTAAPAATVTSTGAALPGGMSLSGTGTLAGTPTKAGVYPLTLTGTNAFGTGTKSQPFTVNPATTGKAVMTSAPASVQPGGWESDTDLRVFGEQMNQTLTAPLTVGGTTIPAGTKVNSYYLHADTVGDANVAHLFTGSVNFGTPVLAVASTTADIRATTPQFGLAGTAYSTSTDQGLEYNDSVTVSGKTRVNVSFTVYNTSDAVRIITAAP